MSSSKVMNPYGDLEIYKVYPDGQEELAFAEHNVITSGMGVAFSHLFAASGSSVITDYQILNFQVGTGGDSSNYGVSSFSLTSPLTVLQYGSGELIVEEFAPIENGSVLGVDEAFPRIRFSNIHRVTDTSVRYTLVLDRGSCNGLDAELDEVGLFVRNPRGLSPASPILVAYRPFTSIKKTSEFSLIFRWTLNFS